MNVVQSGLTTASLISIAVIVWVIYEAFKKPDEEYEAPIGDQPEEDEKEREDREEKEKEYATKALGRDCSGDTQCSASGKFGGRPSGALDRIHCDKGRCEFDRKDYTGVFWFPPSKCVGDIFKGPGSCPVTQEETILREKLRKEGEYESAGESTSIYTDTEIVNTY